MRLPASVLRAMLGHAQQRDPDECVGLLFGHGETVTRHVPLTNTAKAPRTRFFADPTELLRALSGADGLGEALLGLYHSHPDGPSTPSRTDLQNAHYRALTLIVTLRPVGVRAFRLWSTGSEEVGLEVQGGGPS